MGFTEPQSFHSLKKSRIVINSFFWDFHICHVSLLDTDVSFFWSPPKKGIYVVCVCINTCIDDCINVENTSALHSAYLKMYQCDRYDTYNWKYDNYFSIVTMYARQWWYIQLAIYIYISYWHIQFGIYVYICINNLIHMSCSIAILNTYRMGRNINIYVFIYHR